MNRKHKRILKSETLFDHLMLQSRKHRAVLAGILSVALLVSSVTTFNLILPATAMTKTERVLACAYEIHEHTQECYALQPEYNAEGVQTGTENVLICGQADYVVHVHNDDCYKIVPVLDADGEPAVDENGKELTARELVCELPERKAHVHTAACYETVKILACGEKETPGHTHTEACYETKRGAYANPENSEAAHGDYGRIPGDNETNFRDSETNPGELLCVLPEHIHTEECYGDVVTGTEKVLACGMEEGAEESRHTEMRTVMVTEMQPVTHTEYRDEIQTVTRTEYREEVQTVFDSVTRIDEVTGTEIIEQVPRETIVQVPYEVTEQVTVQIPCEVTEEVPVEVEKEVAEEVIVYHTHIDACYEEKEITERRLTCGLEDHTHDDTCYEEKQELICGMEEGEGAHTHDDSCYEDQTIVICGELELHTHTEECYQTGPNGETPEQMGYIHYETDEKGNRKLVGDPAYLTCGLPELKEHRHNADCIKVVQYTAETAAGASKTDAFEAEVFETEKESQTNAFESEVFETEKDSEPEAFESEISETEEESEPEAFESEISETEEESEPEAFEPEISETEVEYGTEAFESEISEIKEEPETEAPDAEEYETEKEPETEEPETEEEPESETESESEIETETESETESESEIETESESETEAESETESESEFESETETETEEETGTEDMLCDTLTEGGVKVNTVDGTILPGEAVLSVKAADSRSAINLVQQWIAAGQMNAMSPAPVKKSLKKAAFRSLNPENQSASDMNTAGTADGIPAALSMNTAGAADIYPVPENGETAAQENAGASGTAGAVGAEAAASAEQTAYQVFDISLENVDASEYGSFHVEVELAPVYARNFRLYHVHDGEVSPLDVLINGEAPGSEAVYAMSMSFDTPDFSAFVLEYTVDFHYEVNGKTYEFSIPGGGFITLRQLAEALNIPETANVAGAEQFAADIQNAEFSDPDLVWVGKAEEDSTVGQIKAAYGLACAYSAVLSVEELSCLNDTRISAGEWLLISLKAFHTEETLTITLTDGEVITIRVTDAQISRDYITASGETYTITVIYGDDAGIPDGAELTVRELPEETDEYTYYLDQAIASLSEEITEVDYMVGLDYARFFDVSIVKDGQKIEPAVPVEVRITYTEPVKLTQDTELKVVHFAESGTEIINIETEETSVTRIEYEQNGFSVIGTVAETNVYGWPTAVSEPYAVLLQDGEDYYAIAHDGTLRKVYYLNGTVSFMGPGTTTMDYMNDYLWDYTIVSSTRHTARLSTYGTDPVSYLDPYFGLLPQNAQTPEAVIGSAQRTLNISNGKIYASYYNTSYSLSAEGGILHRTTLNANDASPIYFAGITSFTADTSESEMYDFIDINVLINKWRTEMTQDLIVDKTAEVYDYANRIYQLDLMASSGYHLISPALALEFVVDASRSMFFPENLHRVQVNGSDYTYSDMQGLRNFFNRLDAGQRDTVFYVITDKNDKATNWAVFYHDANKLTVYKGGSPMASGWYYTDASYFYAPDDYSRNYPYKGGDYCYLLSTGNLGSLNDGFIYTADEKVEGRPWSRLDYMQIAVEAASRVLFAVDPDAQIGLVTFNKGTNSYGPFTADQKDDLISALYNIGLDGGTCHADGLNLAVQEFRNKFKNVKNSQTAVVLISDGAPNGNTWTQIQTAAANVKAMTNAFGQKTQLFTLGLSLENVGENKDKLANISSEPHENFSFSAEQSRDVVNFITKIVEGLVIDADLKGNVTAVIDAGFYPVNPDNGMPLASGTWLTDDGHVTTEGAEDAAGQVLHADGVWKVVWENRMIDWPVYADSAKTEVLCHGWNGRVYVKAQEDFLGGNDISTNGPGSQVEAIQYINRKTGEVKAISSSDAERIKAFSTPYVHVDELLLDENSTEWTVYLGESLDVKDQLQNLVNAVKVCEVVKDDGSLVYDLSPESVTNVPESGKPDTGKTFLLSAVLGELTEDHWNALADGETIEIDYEAYGHIPGTFGISLTQTVAEGEDDLTHSPHDAAVTGEDVEKYELTITYMPFAPAVANYHTGNNGSGSHGADTDNMISENAHTVNVFAKGLHITKTDEGFNRILTGAEFVLYRTARPSDTISDVTAPAGLSGSWYPAAVLDCSGDGTASLAAVEKLKEGESYYLVETEVPAGYYRIDPIPVVITTTDYYIQPAGSADAADRSAGKPSEGLCDWEQTAVLFLNADSGIRRTAGAENTEDLTHSRITADSEDAILYYRIANHTGYSLPATGGSGTGVFYLLGCMLMMLSGVGLVMRSRRR